MSVSARYDEAAYESELACSTFADTVLAVRDQLELLSTLLDQLGLSLDIVRRTVEPSSTWSLRRDGAGWVLDAGEEHGRFGGFRGFAHLHTMLANPHQDLAASDLDAGNRPLLRGLPTLDEPALVAYRRRLTAITEDVESADRAGDQERSAVLGEERKLLLAELRRATGLGGRVRTTSDAAERARVNVTRNIRRALEQIRRATPVAGRHLAASVRTGTHCRYDPMPDGPAGWLLAPTGPRSFGGTGRSAARNALGVSASPSTTPRRI